jgi:hypothetical protein
MNFIDKLDESDKDGERTYDRINEGKKLIMAQRPSR